ncbi:hypothetical protein J1614_009384, partial [Plenodomus biglobosus]
RHCPATTQPEREGSTRADKQTNNQPTNQPTASNLNLNLNLAAAAVLGSPSSSHPRRQHVWYVSPLIHHHSSDGLAHATATAVSKREYYLTMPPDLEGDSTMRSSPSNNDDDNEMFPDEAMPNNNPSTPHHAALAATSEPSPPNSQSQPQSQSQSRDPSLLTTGVNANGKRPLSAAQNAVANMLGGGGTHQDAETGYQWSRPEDQPGFEWKNNRAREDELRALDGILDLGKQIKTRYGDPLDATVPVKTKR